MHSFKLWSYVCVVALISLLQIGMAQIETINLSASFQIGLEISKFQSLDPEIILGQPLRLHLELSNTGKIPVRIQNASLRIQDATSISRLYAIDRILNPNQTLSSIFELSTNGWNPGGYIALINVSYEWLQASAQASFKLSSPPIPPAAPPLIPIIAPVPTPLIPPQIQLLRFPVIKELSPGEDAVLGLWIKNLGKMQLKLNIKSDVPEWVDFSPSELEIPPGSLGAANILIHPPGNAPPGDYLVIYRLEGSLRGWSFFMLRLKQYPPDYPWPRIFRFVELYPQNITHVMLLVKNSWRGIARLELIEDIPKSLAPDLDLIQFETPPRILESDPVVSWLLEDLEPFEIIQIKYSVSRILDEYSDYIYWPLKQVLILPQPPPRWIKLGIHTSPAPPAGISQIHLELENLHDQPLQIQLRILAPLNWKVNPQELNLSLHPLESRTLSLQARVPERIAEGAYSFTLELSYDGYSTLSEFSILVIYPRIPWELILIGIFGFAMLMIFKTRPRYRRELVSLVRRL